MEFDDRDIKTALSSRPLNKKGFTKELEQRILSRIELNRPAPARKNAHLAGTGAVVLLLCVTFVFLPFFFGVGAPPFPQVAPTAEPIGSPASGETLSPAKVPIHSALLIGFRKDEEAWSFDLETGRYRTMLIAEVRGKLQVVAETEGIVVPFGQQFWAIRPATHVSGDGFAHVLTVHPADAEEQDTSVPVPDGVRYAERLLFAGNRYAAVSEDRDTPTADGYVRSRQYWVKELPQINDDTRLSPDYARPAQFVALAQALGGEQVSSLPAGMAQSENWTIARTPGRWVAEIAVNAPSRETAAGFAEVPVPLPASVIAHDELCCTWEQIRSIEPEAEDALFSPTADLLVIFTGRRIDFYAYHQENFAEAAVLSIAREPGESLVMAEWATHQYVDRWIDQARQWHR